MKLTGVMVLAGLLALGLAACQLQGVGANAGQDDAGQSDRFANDVASAPKPASVPKVMPEAAPAFAWSDSSAEDTELSRRVKQSLIGAPGIDVLGIDVYAEDAVVVLVGKVRTRTERERIAAIASVVDGVAGVVNRLRVSADRRRVG
ncbi:MAG: BON domain-containing protein [Betaproteobacteria bacterium]|nr:MAG: BON domain-containing protein [Betaproteobacteria bacterium]